MKKSLLTALGCVLALIVSAQKTDTLKFMIDGVSIHTVLTQPAGEGNFPLALIIAGSGPTDLDGNNPTMKNNSLKMLSEALVAKNIATLRFDKRAVAHSAYAGFNEAELTINNFANDVVELINLMEKRGFKDIYIVGHSEGSLIGLIALQQKPVKGFISVAGVGVPADEILKTQLKPQMPPEMFAIVADLLDSLKNDFQVKSAPQELYALFRPSVQPYLISWFNYSPTELISKLTIPSLILQGDKDIQVGISDAKSLDKAAKKGKLVIIKKMNHVLKDIEGDVQENYAAYTNPDLPINKELSKEIIDFILAKNK
jgi:pimeloyl-ACP methyl ester carboxylesterase